MFLGVLLLLVGALMIMERLDIIQGGVWDYLWPLAIIALGVDFIASARRKHK